MKQKEKELLLKDLCTRLPYGVKISYGNKTYPLSIPYLEDIKNIALGHEYSRGYNIKNISIKPYLRPMSSMTEEERDEVEEISHGWFYINEDGEMFPMGGLSDSGEFEDAILPTFEYFLKNHIDYRGLIPMGIALEAPEGMYK